MTIKEKLIPVILPIDPARPEIYRARNRSKVTSIEEMPYVLPLAVSFSDGNRAFLNKSGNGSWFADYEYDITHQLAEEQPAPARDWSVVATEITNNAVFFIGGKVTCISQFYAETLKTLQDAELEYQKKTLKEGWKYLEVCLRSLNR